MQHYGMSERDDDHFQKSDAVSPTTIPTTFTEQARQLVNEWSAFSNAYVHELAKDDLVPRIASFASEAAMQGQAIGFARAGSVAQMWATSHSCNSHDNDPCCHVRTGTEIERRIKELSPDAGYLDRVRNEAVKAALEQAARWQPIETAPRDGPIVLFAPSLIDEDYNPNGVVEGWHNGVEWLGAIWNNEQDCYDLLHVEPTHWVLLQPPPPIAAIGDDRE